MHSCTARRSSTSAAWAQGVIGLNGPSSATHLPSWSVFSMIVNRGLASCRHSSQKEPCMRWG